MPYPLAPNAVDLTFEFPASGNPASVDLTFGATLGPPPGTVYVATMVAKFSLRGSATINYNIGVWRGLQSDTVARHQQAVDKHKAVAGAWAPSAAGNVSSAAPYGDGVDANSHTANVWGVPASAHRQSAAPWSATAKPTGASASNQWQASNRAHNNASAPWQRGAHVGRSDRAQYGHGKPTHRHDTSPWQQGRAHQSAANSRFNQRGKPVSARTEVPWQQAVVVASYGGPRFLPLPAVTPPVRPDIVAGLQFCEVYDGTGNPVNGLTLVFGLNPCGGITPDSQLYILPARYYMAVHDITAHLLPGLTSIPVFDVALAADVGSTSWSFSASTTADMFDVLTPASGMPQQILITIDGMEWVFVVDGLQMDDSFGNRKAKISGRSATALIADPYARVTDHYNTTSNNAQQLALSALQFSGVDLDWGITDWLVPAGVWSHQGTPLSAVQAVAASVGGYINSHRSDPKVLVRHPYPTLPGGIPGGPWNWGGAFAADVEIAPDAIISRSIQRADNADVDGVWVSGTTTGGIEAHVKRQGTLGAKLAPMVTNPLITATAAASQLGYSVLGKAGAKHLVQITMPVLTGGSNPGVLDVGQLVQLNYSSPWRGRVRAVSVSAKQPNIRQSVTLERHL